MSFFTIGVGVRLARYVWTLPGDQCSIEGLCVVMLVVYGDARGYFMEHVRRKRYEGGVAWNNREIGIEWSQLKGGYKASASAEGYAREDGTELNLSDKKQK